jgi:hypothetical protein
MEVFYERRAAGRTIVLVTHDMATVQALCHRALLIHDGVVQYVGEPEQTAMRYYRLNFAGDGSGDPAEPDVSIDDQPVTHALNARLVHAKLRDAAGATVTNVEHGVPIMLDAAIETAQELSDPAFVFHVRSAEGVVVSSFTRRLSGRVNEGRVIRFAGEIENPLVPGTYALDLWIRQDRQSGTIGLQPMRLANFVVYGTGARQGLVALDSDIEPVLDDEP